jgi:hypothetical protein
MKKETNEYLIKGIKSVPFGVVIGIAAGLLFGFAVGCFVCGLSTLIISNYILETFMIDKESKGINS